MKFIIYAPPPNPKSAGTSIIHNFSHQLNSLGHESRVMELHKIEPYDPESIVVYPEIVPGNPLGAKRIVRYFLHLDGYMTGIPIQRGPDDFIITYFEKFYPGADAELCKFLIPDVFNSRDTKPVLERNINCTFVGKGLHFQQDRIIPETIHIGANGGLSKNGLADLLRNTKILYTYDVLSSILYEAIYCGALVAPLFWFPFDANGFKNTILEFPWVSVVDNTIHIPQNYNEQREEFIERIDSIERNYQSNLELTVEKIRKHFNL